MIEPNHITNFGVALLCSALVIFSYFDIKYREIPNRWILGVALVGSIPTAYLYATGYYSPVNALISIMGIVVFFFIYKFAEDYFHGDDFLAMVLIFLFAIVPPLHPEANALGITTTIYLAGVIFAIAAVNTVWRYGNATRPEDLTISNLLKFGRDERGFPLVVAITIAYYLAVFLP